VKFYRVSRTTERDGHAGYTFFTSKREADAAVADWRKQSLPENPASTGGWEETPKYGDKCEATIEEITVTPTRVGIQTALNKYASHNNNG
jgi:hypothetical protein